MSNLAVSTVAQGLLWAVMALGVYVTFRVLDLADLTCEGSFPLGAATAATLMASGHSVSTAILAAAVAGMLAGAVTGFLTTKMKIPALLAGILTMIALYSVNLRIMGKANLSLLGVDTVFTYTQQALGLNNAYTTFVVGLAATLLIGIGMYWFFGTEIGAAVRATGNNPHMIRANGIDTDVMIVLGLLLTKPMVAILQINRKILMPIIVSLTVVGAYASRSNLFDVKLMLVFGLIGFFLRKMNFPLAPLTLGLILGRTAEA